MSNPGPSRPQHSQQSQPSANHARNHPLYPVVDASAKHSLQAYQAVSKLESSVGNLRGEVKALQTAVNELKELIEKQNKMAFSLKDDGYEALLRTGIAGLFCDSLVRDVKDEDCANLIKRVLKNEVQHRHKADAAKKFCKKMISVFKTEERRRVLGVSPCQQHKLWSTEKLAYNILDYLKAPDSKSEKYIKHLALIRKYVREVQNANEAKQFHVSFKRWIDEKFGGTIDWENIMQLDKQYDYSLSLGPSIELTADEDLNGGIQLDDDDMIRSSPLYQSTN